MSPETSKNLQLAADFPLVRRGRRKLRAFHAPAPAGSGVATCSNRRKHNREKSTITALSLKRRKENHMTPKTNRTLTLGLAALLCGLVVPSAMAQSGKFQTFQLKLHQGINTLKPDPNPPTPAPPGAVWFKMSDVGEATLFGRYRNEGSVLADLRSGRPVLLAGAGTLTAANGDSIGWVLAVDPDNPERIYVVPNTGTGRFEGATGYIDNHGISVTVDPATLTITIIHWAKGELTVPKTEPASGKLQAVTRPFKMEAHSELVLTVADGSYKSTAWINASHCGQSVGSGEGMFMGAGTGKIIAANGDEISFVMPADGTGRSIITGGTGRFAGASGEFKDVAMKLTGVDDPGPEPGTVKYYFVWSAAGTITY
jgi:hypothetical protein